MRTGLPDTRRQDHWRARVDRGRYARMNRTCSRAARTGSAAATVHSAGLEAALRRAHRYSCGYSMALQAPIAKASCGVMGRGGVKPCQDRRSASAALLKTL